MLSLKARLTILLGVLAFLGLSSEGARAQQPDKSVVYQGGKTSTAQVDPIHPQQTVFDINNMTTWVRNDGFFPWEDPFSHVNGTFPKSSGVGAVFTQGILWGGKVRDGGDRTVRVNGSTYQNGLDPGVVLGNDPDESGPIRPAPLGQPAKYHVWRVRPDWETMDYTQAASQFFGVEPANVTEAQRQQIRDQYEYDWNNWPADEGAPFEDVNDNGTYEPGTDIPGWPGADQTMWLVANDLRQGTAARSYGSPAIGVEYQLTLWGYNFPSSSPLGNMHFARARLIYTGTQNTPSDARIDSMFVTQWVDPDVGSFGDDFAGTDTTLSLGYAYNSSNSDDLYDNIGSAPASVGWDFLQGPVNAEGDTLGMTSFVYFAAGSDISDPDLSEYQGTLQWYNLMRGFKPRPAYPSDEPFVNPHTGQPSKFTLTGNPVTGSGWIDAQQLPPGDRRIVLSSGPFDVDLGDTVDVVMGQVGAIGTSNLSSVSLLKFHDQFAQFAYNQDFELPSPPSVPTVNAVERDQKIVLNWGNNHEEIEQTESYSAPGGFEFEGYRVYQLPSPSAPLSEGTRIATYDVQNNVRTLVDNVFEEESGFVVEKPVQTLSNSGLKRFIEISQDRIRQRPLANGVDYHFAVTAFGYLANAGPDAPFRILESSPVTVSATPQPPAPGETHGSEVASTVELSHDGTSTSNVTLTHVDPTVEQSGEYSLNFAYYNPYTGETKQELAPGDTLREVPEGFFENEKYSPAQAFTTGDPFPLRWQLQRGGEAISAWRPQIDPAGPVPKSAAPIIEGLQVYVPLVTPGIANFSIEGESWLSGVNAGLAQFGGSLDLAHNVFGSNLPKSQLERVVIEYQGDVSGGYASEGAVYVRGQGYAYEGIGELPLEAFAVSSNGERRKLNVSFVESSLACSNLEWDLGTGQGGDCTALGNREYLFVHATDYDGGETYAEVPGGFVQDVMYFYWPALAEGASFAGNPFSMTIQPSIALTADDAYTFNVEAPETGNEQLAEEQIEEINVFPNPYVGYSKLEDSRSNKFVTFNHLPEQATIRIFTLDGTMVRVIEHNRDSQFEEWDLTNQDGIPVASGLYIAHVETEFGEKIVKLALVQEEQILERY